VKRTALAVLVAALASTAAAAGAPQRAQACKAGVHTIGTTTYRVFCGPARASIKVGKTRQSFRHGSCLKIAGGRVFTMSIGTLQLGAAKPRYSYLGITVPGARHDGSYRRAVVAWAYAGKRYTLYNVAVKLSGKRTRGTFSGRVVGRRGTVTGSFRCR
jgi:hypothetical protein